MVSSTTYPVFEYERKGKKRRRGRRIAVVRDNSGPVWFPPAVEFSARVKTDGGTMETIECLNSALRDLYI